MRDEMTLCDALACQDVASLMCDLPVAKLRLPIRLVNILESNGLYEASRVGQILRLTRKQLASIPNVGERSIVLIEDELRNLATGLRSVKSCKSASSESGDDKMIIVKTLWEPLMQVCGSSPMRRLWYFDVLGPESASSFIWRK